MTITSRRRPDNSEALAAFVARKTEFDRLLARLQRLSDNHFHVDPDEVTAFREGECAG
ncbi:MAG: hypothetical protein U1E42_03725 [Rhodospirillales bacterium]